MIFQTHSKVYSENNEAENEIIKGKVDKMSEHVDKEERMAKLMGKTVTMAHGAGGRQTSELIDMIFKAHFENPDLTADDAAVLAPPAGKDGGVNRMVLSYLRHSIRAEISESSPSAVQSMICPAWGQNHYI